MPVTKGEKARETLVRHATELFRRNGFVATAVDDICRAAGVTKGAFFHHFASKEALGEACLRQWDAQLAAMHDGAAFNAIADPLKKLLACMDLYAATFSDPGMIKSCLAGTTVQEVSETNPVLRDAANACFVTGHTRLKALLEDAARRRKRRIDADGLAALWFATLQGALILYKASREVSVVRNSLGHVREYVRALLEDPKSKPKLKRRKGETK